MGDDLESSTTFSETSFQQSPNNDQDGDTMDAGSDKDEEDLTFEKELPPSMPDDSCIGGITEAIAQCQTYRVRMQQLRVFVPCTDPSDGTQVLHKLHVAVPETARAPDVIVLALQQLQGEQANVPPEQRFFFHTNPNFYRLRVAEDDTGTIEEDVPALDWNSKVNRLDTLVMCCSDGSESGSSRDPIQPARKTLEDLTFFVNYVRQSRTTRRRLSLPPDVLYRDLLGLVCEKLNRDPKKHQIKLVLGGVYRTSLSDGSLPTEKTLTTLYHTFAVHEFALEPLGPEAEEEEDDEVDAAPEEDDGRGVLYTEYDASKYQEFHVIKINKWGVRQPRILGMDRSTIYNMMPKREKTLVGSVRRTQHPDRGIEDIEAIRQPDPTRPLYFEVDYKNKQTPTDRIECLTKRDAQELLSKLRFLIELHRPEQQKRGGARVDRRVLGTGMARFRTGMGAIMHTLSDVPDDLVKKLKGELIPTSAEY
eukprot:GGOE01062122.1.p1 GENE.GGOE01062122.1~~GGOE01062122.1.p1  ORF type:complete len:550 (-),score=185.26 GGOE01062122.1:462-1892(-)